MFKYMRKVVNYLHLRIFLLFFGQENSELYFWKYVAKMKNFDNLNSWKKIFPSAIKDYIKNSQTTVLEIGSGPFSILNWGAKNKLFKVTAVDPLAESYNDLLDKPDYSDLIRPIKGSGESLIKMFGSKKFDIIYSSNALDHTTSPKDCILNMYHVLKLGGIMFLEGFVKVGTLENWTGLHQHDLIPMNNHLFCYDKKGRYINLTKEVGLRCVYFKLMDGGERDPEGFMYGKNENLWYTMVFKK